MILSAAPSSRKVWTTASLVVGAVHLGAVGVLFLRIAPAFDPMTDRPAIAVEMAPPSSLPAPIHDAPTPQQVEAPEQTQRVTPSPKTPPFDPPPEQKVAGLKPEVVLPPRKDERPVEKANPLPPAPTTTQLAAPDLKPDTKVAAQITGGASAGKATQADLWDARVLSRIELMKRYPALAARQNQQDEVKVLLTIDRGGRLLDSRIAGSRGLELLDQAALDAVRRASPFAKPPAEVAGDPIRVAVIVRFFKKTR